MSVHIIVSSPLQGSICFAMIWAVKQIQHEPCLAPYAVCSRLNPWPSAMHRNNNIQNLREFCQAWRRSLAEELTAALGGDAALSATTPLRTWEETVVPQVCKAQPRSPHASGNTRRRRDASSKLGLWTVRAYFRTELMVPQAIEFAVCNSSGQSEGVMLSGIRAVNMSVMYICYWCVRENLFVYARSLELFLFV